MLQVISVNLTSDNPVLIAPGTGLTFTYAIQVSWIALMV
jgi:hypothetical protein